MAHKIVNEKLLGDDASIGRMRFISESELNHRITGNEVPFRDQEQSTTPLWGLHESILTKKV